MPVPSDWRSDRRAAGRHQPYTLEQWQGLFNWAVRSPETGSPVAGAIEDHSELLCNDTEEMKTIALTGTYTDLDGPHGSAQTGRQLDGHSWPFPPQAV